MSKIYEALLRAEQERTERENAPKEPSKPSNYRQPSTLWTAVATMDPGLIDAGSMETQSAARSGIEPELEQEPIPNEWPVEQRRPVESLRPVPLQPVSLRPEPLRTLIEDLPTEGHTDVSTLEAVPFRSWKPLLARLPALLERGAPVEQFRSLRSRLQEFRDLNTLKTVMVSSGVPQEGKTFIAANLAISLARHDDSRVLLIDGDMRRASLYKVLGCPNEPGLTEYLAGNATLHEVMQRARLDDPEAPVPRGLHSLTFIGGGREADRAADLSGNDRFTDLIKAAAPLFDWIIVDSSPVNLVADGVNLSRSCDGVLLVARAGVTKFEVTQRALSELKAAKMLGIVLNAVVDPPVAAGYYGYDGYVGSGSGVRDRSDA